MLGYTPNELCQISALSLFHPEDRETLFHLFQSSPSHPPPIQARVRRKDGTWIWIEAHVRPVLQESTKEIIEYVSIIRDITERKEIEAHLHQREEALLVFNEELLRATQHKERFLTQMSVALRSPIDAVLSVTQTLLEGVYGPLNEQQERCLSAIIHSVDRQRAVLDDILEISGLESGRLPLQRQTIPLFRLCQDSLQQTRDLASQRHIRLRFFMDAELESIDVDEKRMRQVLIGLLRHVLYFTDPGGEVHLEAELDQDRQAVTFRIHDIYGKISTHDLSRLFEPFGLHEQHPPHHSLGTGLELALAKRLVALHQGSITVENHEQQGASFSISIPLAPPRSPQPTAPKPHQPPPKNAPTLLVAEDVETNILTLVDYLEASGFHVQIARNGQEAVDGAHQYRPALILMDIQMPVMNGLEAIKKIKSQSETSDIPIIALTALAMPGDRERCLQAGAVEYLSKPVSLSDLVQRIRTLVAPSPTKISTEPM